MFCENVVTLIRWMCKSYSTFDLFKWHCSYRGFFFFFNNWFVFCSLLNIYVRWYIYCYTNKSNFTIFLQLLTCVNALKHCSYRALVSWANFFFFPKFWIVTIVPCTVVTFFSLLNIYISWYIYCYIGKTNFTIFS